MADTKISALTELAEALGTGDLVPIVDVSDTSMAASGTTKYITKENLLAGANVKTVETRTSLGTVTLGTAGDCFFDNISQDYDDLVVVYRFRPGGGSGTRYLYAYLNEDTTDTNYRSASVGALSGGAWNFSVDFPLSGQLSGTVSNYYCDGELWVKNYTDGSDPKFIEGHFSAFTAANAGTLAYIRIETAITAAVTQFRLDFPTHGVIGEAELFGVKQETIGAVTREGDAGTVIHTLIPEGTRQVNSSADEFNFSSIPAYDNADLVVKGKIRSSATGFDSGRIWINGDTTATNYNTQRNGADNSTSVTTKANNSTFSYIANASSGANDYTDFTLRIPNYTDSKTKTAFITLGGDYGTATMSVGLQFIESSITAAVTQLQIQADGHATDGLVGDLQLYIEKDLVVAPGLHEVETIVADGSTITDFDFQNIPSGFRRIIIKGYMRSTATSGAGNVDDAIVYLNNDTTAGNYWYTMVYGLNTTAGASDAGSSNRFAQIINSAGTAIGHSDIDCTIERYADANKIKSMRVNYHNYRASGSEIAVYEHVVGHDSMTAAINRVTIQCHNDPTDVLEGELTLYVEY